MEKKVGMVVVTYNRLELLKGAIDSLRAQTWRDREIIVVNNGSTDGTREWLGTQADLVTITQDNLGGAGGFFTGMKWAAEHGCDFAWIMDDDVVCAPEALEELVKAFHVAPDSGFVCSRVLGTDGLPMQVNTAAVDRHILYFDPSFLSMAVDHAMVRVVEATFVSVLIPTRIMRQDGLPIPEYFIWCDDVEYTARLSSRHPCYIALRSEVTHLRKASTMVPFAQVKDPARLKYHSCLFRNYAYTCILRGDKRGAAVFICHRLLDALCLCLRLKFRHAWIIVRSLASLATFHPKIQYPAPVQPEEGQAHDDSATA